LRGQRRRAAFRSLACGAALAVLGWVEHAQAAAGEWQAGGRLGVAWLSRPGLGPALDAYVRRGLTPAFDFDLQVLASVHPFQLGSKSRAAASESEAPWALGMVPGLLYRWDVFRVVPYAGIGLGFYSWNRAVTSSAGGQFGAAGRVGLDYLLNRSVVLSVQASAHVVFEGAVPWLQLGVGAAHAWGW
jgi:hypothetical protein